MNEKTSSEKEASSPPDFEKDFAKLEKIINSLEENDLPLEKAIEAFEKAMGLLGSCQQVLHDAEQKVSRLIEKNGIFESERFEENRKR